MKKRKIFSGGEFLIADTQPDDIFSIEEISKEHQMIYRAAMDFVKKEIQSNIDQIEQKDEQYAKRPFKGHKADH